MIIYIHSIWHPATDVWPLINFLFSTEYSVHFICRPKWLFSEEIKYILK